MVDGKTIDKIRLDLDIMIEQVAHLKERVATLENIPKMTEALNSKEFHDFIESLVKSNMATNK